MRIFQKQGYHVTVAARGGEAIEKLNSNRFDVTLIDLCLPDMEGTQLFPMIEHNSPRALKIMWSGKIMATERITGADAILGKPIQPAKLLSIIDNKLKNKNIEI